VSITEGGSGTTAPEEFLVLETFVDDVAYPLARPDVP